MLQYQVPERRQTDVRLHDSKDQRIIMRNYEINSSNKETGANYSLWITQQITHTVRKVQFLKQAFQTLCFLRSMQNIWVFFSPVKCSCFVPVITLELKFTFTFTYVHTPTVLHLPDHARINAFLFLFFCFQKSILLFNWKLRLLEQSCWGGEERREWVSWKEEDEGILTGICYSHRRHTASKREDARLV